MEIYRSNWFKTLFNTTETEWIQNPNTGMFSHNMGKFSVFSINELTQKVKSLNIPYLPEFIIYVRKSDDNDDTFFDTSSLQLMNMCPEMDTYPVMFQVASNFNCQENGSHMINFRSGNYLTGLMSDSTQGPSASAGAGVGAVLRLSSHLSSGINLLKHTPYGSDVIEGKLYASTRTQEIDINTVCVGLHTNVPANFDRSQFGKTCLYHKQGRIIDQVFTSTIISPSNQHLKVTANLLYSAYLGTYLSALSRNTEILILTLIGGGCFDNPIDLIMSTIAKVHVNISYKGNLKKVILPIYDISRSPDQIVKYLLSFGYPQHLIKIIKK